MPAESGHVVLKGDAEPGTSTTLAVIVTNCDLARADAKRVAIAAHDGIAMAIFPAHTPLDGDLVFALATAAVPLDDRPRALVQLCAGAASTLARAIAIAVFNAESGVGDRIPTWRQRYLGA